MWHFMDRNRSKIFGFITSLFSFLFPLKLTDTCGGFSEPGIGLGAGDRTGGSHLWLEWRVGGGGHRCSLFLMSAGSSEGQEASAPTCSVPAS